MAYGLKYNPFIDNLQYVTKNDFLPWATIPVGVSVEISEDREMITTDELEILGELIVKGKLTLLSQTIDDDPERNTIVGNNTQDILDSIYGPTESCSFSYNPDGTIDYVEYFSNATQVTANRIYRIDLTYNADLEPLTETHKHYSTDDGTTILKTITITYTWSSNVLTSKTQVTT